MQSSFRYTAVLFTLLVGVLCTQTAQAQVFINEGSNRNYSTLPDEDGDYPDWIELYNAGTDTVFLHDYALSDANANDTMWTFPAVKLAPAQYKPIFCSGKDRKPIAGFVDVESTQTFTAVVGWNVHTLAIPFYWDGVSNLLINTCSYSSAGYISNSSFYQSATAYPSTVAYWQDGNDAACSATNGSVYNQRPNMRLNGMTIGSGTIQNSNTDYPAPYGNWYWGARHQMLIRASELTAAGLTAGNITNIAFNVAGTDPNVHYDYVDFSFRLVDEDVVTNVFQTVDPNNYLHTNFKLETNGETVFLFSPAQLLLDSLHVQAEALDVSNGSFPDSSNNIAVFPTPTPAASNNLSQTATGYLVPPVITTASGIFTTPQAVSISNPNAAGSEVRYTLDGNTPTDTSLLYTGTPVMVYYSSVLRARAFQAGKVPSTPASGSFLIGVSHTTPILSVITDNASLYGTHGIFEHWDKDWEKAAYAEYFDTAHQLIFSQRSGMQVDGGWGGSRYLPQHSFRLELDDNLLGENEVNYPLIPNRPTRNEYSRIYLRNGSNQWLNFFYKDACQTEMMCNATNTYYSAYRPVSVYINGAYFGMYELREKFDEEFFSTYDGADKDSTTILSLSAWNSFVLRSVAGEPADSFLASYWAWDALDQSLPTYWAQADQYFDMKYYTDYIISESWMLNTDWPGNNIKIYRSNATNKRWRYATIDLELSMAPNGWQDCYFDHIDYMLNSGGPFIEVWKQSIQNAIYHDYFINRFADVMNTAYKAERLTGIEDKFFNEAVVEMPREYQRWGDPNQVPAQMDAFVDRHNTFQQQLNARSIVVREDIETHFTLPNQLDLTLDVHPAGAGKIHISTITPDEYPWEGIYFNGVPVRMQAIADSGYHFLHWGANALLFDTMNAIWLDTLNTTAIQFDAYFEQDTTADTVIIIDGIHQRPEALSSYFVYPNPAGNDLFVQCRGKVPTGAVTLEVMDMSGRIVKTENWSNFKGTGRLDVRALSSSLYTLRITDSNHRAQHLRFMKKGE